MNALLLVNSTRYYEILITNCFKKKAWDWAKAKIVLISLMKARLWGLIKSLSLLIISHFHKIEELLTDEIILLPTMGECMIVSPKIVLL